MADDFKNGLARVAVTNEWGFINKKEIFVIPPKYTMASEFQESGLALVYDDVEKKFVNKGGKWRLINRTGAFASSLQFDNTHTESGVFLQMVCKVF